MDGATGAVKGAAGRAKRTTQQDQQAGEAAERKGRTNKTTDDKSGRPGTVHEKRRHNHNRTENSTNDGAGCGRRVGDGGRQER